jgi:hypothetical protein
MSTKPTAATRKLITVSTALESAISGEKQALQKMQDIYRALATVANGNKALTTFTAESIKPVLKAVYAECQKRSDWPKEGDKAKGEKEARGTETGDFWNRFSAWLREQVKKQAGTGNRVSGDWQERLVKALAKICAQDNIDPEDMTIEELVEHLGKADLFKESLDKQLEKDAA